MNPTAITPSLVALNARLQSLCSDASAEELAYLGRALEAFGTGSTVADVAATGDTQNTRLVGTGDAQVNRVVDQASALVASAAASDAHATAEAAVATAAASRAETAIAQVPPDNLSDWTEMAAANATAIVALQRLAIAPLL